MSNLLIYMNCKHLKATDVGNKKRIVEFVHSACIHEGKIAQIYSATTINLFI